MVLILILIYVYKYNKYIIYFYHFILIDDDTHPYYIDSFYSLNNSTRSEEELFEDLDDSKSSVSFLSTSYTPPSSLKHL